MQVTGLPGSLEFPDEQNAQNHCRDQRGAVGSAWNHPRALTSPGRNGTAPRHLHCPDCRQAPQPAYNVGSHTKPEEASPDLHPWVNTPRRARLREVIGPASTRPCPVPSRWRISGMRIAWNGPYELPEVRRKPAGSAWRDVRQQGAGPNAEGQAGSQMIHSREGDPPKAPFRSLWRGPPRQQGV